MIITSHLPSQSNPLSLFTLYENATNRALCNLAVMHQIKQWKQNQIVNETKLYHQGQSGHCRVKFLSIVIFFSVVFFSFKLSSLQETIQQLCENLSRCIGKLCRLYSYNMDLVIASAQLLGLGWPYFFPAQNIVWHLTRCNGTFCFGFSHCKIFLSQPLVAMGLSPAPLFSCLASVQALIQCLGSMCRIANQ